MFKLSTEDLKIHIVERASRLGNLSRINEYNFVENNHGSADGFYIYSDGQRYHFVYSERGTENTHNVTDNLFEITYWVISSITDTLAIAYMRAHISSNQAQRKVIFDQKLRLLSMVGENYKKAGEIEISELLKTAPL
ncbi:Imm63 family immunity protein [Lactiplantibacillus pentosus]|uniref:Imm63 family immunity protein n=1 Tax=Lactiplantibacillus pentosus TaxID=1589 RepID=UPI0026FB3C90|nr:Imm63 family immunity protein [Lactiplantibacillus pentosus]MDO7805988.1 Imm63 family immunity protein [Lactiplantibacillus pentosus]